MKVPRWRCLHDGYPLDAAPATGARADDDARARCPECGRRYKRALLARQFGGVELDRLQRVLWLVKAGLVCLLWTGSDALPLGLSRFSHVAWLGAFLAGGYAAFVAGAGRFRSAAGNYALTGLAAAGAGVLLAGRDLLVGHSESSIAVPAATDVLVAGMVLVAMAHDAEGRRMWSARFAQRTFLTVLVLLPVALLGWSAFALLLFGFGPVALRVPAGLEALRDLGATAVAFTTWAYAWWKLHGLERGLYR